VVIVDSRLFHVNMALLWSAIGGGHKAVQTCQVQEETHQTNATGPDFDTDQMDANHEAVYKRQTGAALQELGDVGTAIEAIVPQAPGLPGGAGHLEFLRSLTLGEARRAQLPVLLKEGCAFASIPAWRAIMVAVWPILDDGSHRDLLGQSLAF
jgi:hypothetical protein